MRGWSHVPSVVGDIDAAPPAELLGEGLRTQFRVAIHAVDPGRLDQVRGNAQCHGLLVARQTGKTLPEIDGPTRQN